jgi:hypothetical protein
VLKQVLLSLMVYVTLDFIALKKQSCQLLEIMLQEIFVRQVVTVTWVQDHLKIALLELLMIGLEPNLSLIVRHVKLVVIV